MLYFGPYRAHKIEVSQKNSPTPKQHSLEVCLAAGAGCLQFQKKKNQDFLNTPTPKQHSLEVCLAAGADCLQFQKKIIIIIRIF